MSLRLGIALLVLAAALGYALFKLRRPTASPAYRPPEDESPDDHTD